MAGGIADILAGRTTPGLHQAASAPDAVQRWLDFLAEHGVTAGFREPSVGYH